MSKMRLSYKYFLPILIGLVLFGRLTLSSYVLCVDQNNAATIEYSVGTDCAEKAVTHEPHDLPVLDQVQVCQDWILSSDIAQTLPYVPEIFVTIVADVTPKIEGGNLRPFIARVFELRTPVERSLKRQISATILVI